MIAGQPGTSSSGVAQVDVADVGQHLHLPDRLQPAGGVDADGLLDEVGRLQVR